MPATATRGAGQPIEVQQLPVSTPYPKTASVKIQPIRAFVPWDPEEIIEIQNPESRSCSCVGYADSKRRRCQRAIGAPKRQMAFSLLSGLAKKEPDAGASKKVLNEVAELFSCYQHDSNQEIDTVVRKWQLKIKQFAEEREADGESIEEEFAQAMQVAVLVETQKAQQEQLAATKRDLNGAEKEIKGLNKEIKVLKEERDNLEGRVEELEEEKEGLGEAKKEVDVEKARIAAQQSVLKTQQEALATERKVLDSSKASHKAATQDLHASKEQINTAQQALTASRAAFQAEQTKAQADFQADQEKAKGLRRKFKSQKAELERDAQSLAADRKSLTLERQSLSSERSALLQAQSTAKVQQSQHAKAVEDCYAELNTHKAAETARANAHISETEQRLVQEMHARFTKLVAEHNLAVSATAESHDGDVQRWIQDIKGLSKKRFSLRDGFKLRPYIRADKIVDVPRYSLPMPSVPQHEPETIPRLGLREADESGRLSLPLSFETSEVAGVERVAGERVLVAA